MRKFFVACLGVALLGLVSGCGGAGSNKVERPANPVPVRKDVKPISASAPAGQVPAPPPKK
jgi:hypothetical protein